MGTVIVGAILAVIVIAIAVKLIKDKKKGKLTFPLLSLYWVSIV